MKALFEVVILPVSDPDRRCGSTAISSVSTSTSTTRRHRISASSS